MVPKLTNIYVTLLAIAVSSLAGCADYIGFYERSDTDLSVALSPSAASPEPVAVNLGYNRHIYAVVPKKCSKFGGLLNRAKGDQQGKGNGKAAHDCETKSLISNFYVSLGQTKDRAISTSSFETHLRNGFATGEAAKTLAANPTAAKELLGLKLTLAKDDPDNSKRRAAVASCVQKIINGGVETDQKVMIGALEQYSSIVAAMKDGQDLLRKLSLAYQSLSGIGSETKLSQAEVDSLVGTGGDACKTGV